MSANVDLEKVAALIGESIDFVRVNLQEGTLLIDGEPIGYAVKKKETQKKPQKNRKARSAPQISSSPSCSQS